MFETLENILGRVASYNPNINRRDLVIGGAKVAGTLAGIGMLVDCSGDGGSNNLLGSEIPAGSSILDPQETLQKYLTTRTQGGILIGSGIEQSGRQFVEINGNRLYENATEEQRAAYLAKATTLAGATSIEGATDHRLESVKWLKPLRADFSLEGKVEFADFVLFVQHFGKQQGQDGYDSTYDLDSNGRVEFADFVAFVGDFNKEQTSNGIGLYPLMTPGGLQVRYPLSTNHRGEALDYRITLLGADGRPITDRNGASKLAQSASEATLNFDTGLQGEGVDVQYVGTDPIGDEIVGGRETIMMPVHYYNGGMPESKRIDFNVDMLRLMIQMLDMLLISVIDSDPLGEALMNLTNIGQMEKGR